MATATWTRGQLWDKIVEQAQKNPTYHAQLKADPRSLMEKQLGTAIPKTVNIKVVEEATETNPGLFGKSLARWLAEQLHAAGFPAGTVFAEDFGWCIPVGSKPHALYVVCEGHGDAQWRVFAFAEGGLIARLFGKDRRAA